MSNIVLNDLSYNFEPLKLFQPEPDYRVNEKELKKSKEKSRALIEKIRRNQKEVVGGNSCVERSQDKK